MESDAESIILNAINAYEYPPLGRKTNNNGRKKFKKDQNWGGFQQ